MLRSKLKESSKKCLEDFSGNRLAHSSRMASGKKTGKERENLREITR